MLRTLLTHADEDPQVAQLAETGGRAFVSQSLRPYLLAALLDGDPDRPAIVVAGDDRAARDLASGLRTWLEPRPVRYYPSRGVTYESHLAPPPHLVGLRIAALDALIEGGYIQLRERPLRTGEQTFQALHLGQRGRDALAGGEDLPGGAAGEGEKT